MSTESKVLRMNGKDSEQIHFEKDYTRERKEFGCEETLTFKERKKLSSLLNTSII